MGDVIEVSWANILEEEGVLKRGFGSIPKYAMLDPNLSITAKAIYAYLCACAGSGTSTYPGRDTIIFHLGINKDTYHKYSKELRDSGYISVRKVAPKPGQAHKFTHNNYTIEAYPKRFSEDPRYQISNPDSGDTISVKGIRAAGYGMIPRMVMEDQRVGAKAKALYAYLAAFTGGGKTAFPEIKKTLYHLHISRNTYFSLIKELIEVNYVEVEQRHVNGRLSVNDYYLVPNPSLANAGKNTRQRKIVVSSPDSGKKAIPEKLVKPAAAVKMQDYLQNIPGADVSVLAENILHNYSQEDVASIVYELLQKMPHAGMALQSTNFSDTGENGQFKIPEPLAREAFAQCPKISDIEKQDTGKQDIQKQDLEEQDSGKQDTQESDTIINNTTINSSSINNFSIINPINQQYQSKTPLCDLFDTMDKSEIEREIKEKMGFLAVEYGGTRYNPELHQALITLVVDTISQKTPKIRIGKKEIDREEVVSRLYELTYMDYEHVIDSVQKIRHEIRNLPAYYLAALYNAKNSAELDISRQVAIDS